MRVCENSRVTAVVTHEQHERIFACFQYGLHSAVRFSHAALPKVRRFAKQMPVVVD